MIIQIIGWYCVFHTILGELTLITSIKDVAATPDSRARVVFMNIGYAAVAAWCFK